MTCYQMPEIISEKSLAPVRLDNSELAVQDDSGHYNPLDLEEYTNRELVNLENAAVNIENSSDVIIGPVTQFNVNGNVTIFQNGQETIEGEPVQKEDTSNAKLPKIEQPQDLDPKYLLKRKALKLLAWLIFALLLLISAAISLVYVVNQNSESETNDLYMPQPINNYTNIGRHHLITKKEWGGRRPKSIHKISTPVDMVVIKHTGGGTCNSFQRCAGKMQSLQSSSVREGLWDIYCNFVIGGDGNIYEGRGFDAQSADNDSRYDIVFMGSFDLDEPTPASLDAAKTLIRHAFEINKLSKDYKVVNHNQTCPTLSPGSNIMKEVMKWPHYDPGLYFSEPLKRK